MFLFKSELNIYLRIPETPTALLRRRRVARHETHDFGSVVIAVGFEPSALASLCRSVTLAARYGTSPYAMPYERNRPIVICRNMRPSLSARWSEFKHYGIEYWPQATERVVSLAALP